MIGTTLVISIVSYIFQIGWFVECLGFAYGIILYNKEKNINSLLETNYIKKILIEIAVSIILGILYIKLKNIIIVNYFLKILLGISIISLIICLLKKIKANNKILSFLGKISFEIYLLHDMIMQNLIGLNVTSGLYIIISLTVTIASASFMNYIDSKIAKSLKV